MRTCFALLLCSYAAPLRSTRKLRKILTCSGKYQSKADKEKKDLHLAKIQILLNLYCCRSESHMFDCIYIYKYNRLMERYEA